jgi:hypothetical protein
MGKRDVVILAIALLCSLLAMGGVLAQTTASVDWWVFGSGGGQISGDGGVALDGTLGQPIVGPAGGDAVLLGSGYWYGIPATHRVYLPVVLRDT